MRYRVGVAVAGYEVNATVFDFVGCATTASDRAGLQALLPVVIAEHLAWLRRHGEPIADDAFAVQPEIVEEIDPRECDAADGEFVFAADRDSVTDGDIESGIRAMNYATSDLLSVIEALPERILDWRPPVAAMAKIDEWQPAVKTIREIASGLPAGERYYRLGLREGPEPHEPQHEWYDRNLQREQTIERLRGLSHDERDRAFYVTRPWQDRPEHWTARKAMRRIISHERFHTKEIQQRLSWLLLGVPEFKARLGALIGEGALHA